MFACMIYVNMYVVIFLKNELTIHKFQAFKEAMHLSDISSLEVYF